jgi:hypothetical protein
MTYRTIGTLRRGLHRLWVLICRQVLRTQKGALLKPPISNNCKHCRALMPGPVSAAAIQSLVSRVSDRGSQNHGR